MENKILISRIGRIVQIRRLGLIRQIGLIAMTILFSSYYSYAEGIATKNEVNNNINNNKVEEMEEMYDKDDVVVELKTTEGDIVVELFNDTPLHRDNFVKLVKDGVYDGVLFHRVIDNFMIQTGDPNSKTAEPGQMLGDGDLGYTIEAEIDYPKHYNKYGALAAARTGDNINPERRSSASQFYIVTGKKMLPQQLEVMEMRKHEEKLQARFRELVVENRDSISALQKGGDEAGLEELRQRLIKETEESVDLEHLPENIKEDYINKGGAPHLDGGYTVFGQVLKGMDVVEKIQKVETDENDRPLEDVRVISARILPSASTK